METVQREALFLRCELDQALRRGAVSQEKLSKADSALKEKEKEIQSLKQQVTSSKKVGGRDATELAEKLSFVTIELEALREAHNNLLEEADTKEKVKYSLQVMKETLSRKNEQLTSQLSLANEEKEKNGKISAEQLKELEATKLENASLKAKILELENSFKNSQVQQAQSVESQKTLESSQTFSVNIENENSSTSSEFDESQLSSTSVSSSTKISIGDKVKVQGKTCDGTIRFIGQTQFATGEWVGVELDKNGEGKHNGTVKGRFYFSCSEPGDFKAIFVKPSQIQVISSDSIFSFSFFVIL